MQDESAWCAALYLLTADMFLWSKAEAAVRPDLIDFHPSIFTVWIWTAMFCFIQQKTYTKEPNTSAFRN